MTDQLVALLDGRLVSATDPLLRPDDPGAVRGDGVFEATVAVDRQVRDLDGHLNRLAASARALDLAVPEEQAWRGAVNVVNAAWTGGREMALRLYATRGSVESTCWVSGAAVPATAIRQRRTGIRVLLLGRGQSGAEVATLPWLLPGAKTLSYAINMAALRYAESHHADDVIFLGSDGLVLEAPTAAVVAAFGRQLVTPATDGILDSITARRLFTAAGQAGWECGYAALAPVDLERADGVWLVSGVRLLAPVNSLDGRPRGDGGLTVELASLLQVPEG